MLSPNCHSRATSVSRRKTSFSLCCEDSLRFHEWVSLSLYIVFTEVASLRIHPHELCQSQGICTTPTVQGGIILPTGWRSSPGMGGKSLLYLLSFWGLLWPLAGLGVLTKSREWKSLRYKCPISTFKLLFILIHKSMCTTNTLHTHTVVYCAVTYPIHPWDTVYDPINTTPKKRESLSFYSELEKNSFLDYKSKNSPGSRSVLNQ